MELRLLLRHYLVHPISVNQSNAAVLPIMLSSKPLPEMEAQETALAAELYQTAGLEGLPQEQQLARLMVTSVEAWVVKTVGLATYGQDLQLGNQLCAKVPHHSHKRCTHSPDRN